MREWLDHYLAQGVDHFFLIDDNSTDAFQRALWPYLGAGQATLASTGPVASRLDAYNASLHRSLQGRSRWVLVVDLDEFLYATSPRQTIKSILKTLETNSSYSHISQICVPWKMFGSSGYTKQPRCVVPSFTARQPTPTTDDTPIKCMARVDQVQRLGDHHHTVTGPTLCADGTTPRRRRAMPDAPDTNWGCSMARNRRAPLLQLNHYPFQAKDYFYSKATEALLNAKKGGGGGVLSAKAQKQMAAYFLRHDKLWRGVTDTELAQRQNSRRGPCQLRPESQAAVGYQALLWELDEAPATL